VYPGKFLLGRLHFCVWQLVIFHFTAVTMSELSLTLPGQGANELAPTLADPCKAGMLKAGTLEELVDHLVPALLFGDPTYIPIFLCTYRRFATTQQVLDLLFTR
jgi:hypothetical protein